jgi:hypothetical protein
MARLSPGQYDRVYGNTAPHKGSFIGRRPLLTTLIIVAAAATLAWIACGLVFVTTPPPATTADAPAASVVPAQEPYQEFLQEKFQKLSDGRTVMCLYREGRISGYSGGATPTLSCDWDNAIVHPPK